jgi:hypothetical protein
MQRAATLRLYPARFEDPLGRASSEDVVKILSELIEQLHCCGPHPVA